MSKFKLECNEANLVCDKSQYKEASFFEKIRLSIHLLYCGMCRKYNKTNNKLTSVIESSDVTCLDDKTKIKMKAKVNKVLEEIQY